MKMCRLNLALGSLGVVLIGFLLVMGEAQAENPCLPHADTVAEVILGGDTGIGGTGRAEEDSGIGGTGVFGTITGFGSVCVNGLQIRYDDDAAVEINGQVARIEDLARGQLVWIEALLEEGEFWTDRISVFSAVIGRVRAVDVQQWQLDVSGQIVEVPEDAILIDALDRSMADLSGVVIGDVVDVSGLRRGDGHIVASRLERAAAPPGGKVGVPELRDLVSSAPAVRRLALEGYLEDRVSAGEFRIGGLVVDTSMIPGIGELEPNTRVWLSGTRLGQAALRVERVVVNPLRPEERPDPSGSEALKVTPEISVEDLSESSVDKPDPVEQGTEVPFTDELTEPKEFQVLEAPTTVETLDLPDAPEPVDRPERLERPERIERVVRPDRPEPLERPEPVERLEKLERAEGP
jgi:hypothetical protein